MAYEAFRATAGLASVFMDTVGDQSGSTLMNVDGSTTPVEFKTTASANEVLLVNRFIVTVQDTGAFDSGAYGNAIVLTNGITLYIRRASGEICSCGFDQHPVKQNVDWGTYCHDLTLHTFGSGDQLMTARYTFVKDGAPVILNPGDTLVCAVRDDLSGLTDHHMRLGMTSYRS